MARVRIFILISSCLLAAGCEPVAIALLGAGASTAFRYNLDNVASRTFTAPVVIAPAMIAKSRDAIQINCRREELELAQQRLIDADKIHIETYGPPSKERKPRLALIRRLIARWSCGLSAPLPGFSFRSFPAGSFAFTGHQSSASRRYRHPFSNK